MFKVGSQTRGQYDIVDDDKNIYSFTFPLKSTVGTNYDVLSFLRDELWKAMEEQRKKEEKVEEKAPQEEKKEENLTDK